MTKSSQLSPALSFTHDDTTGSGYDHVDSLLNGHASQVMPHREQQDCESQKTPNTSDDDGDDMTDNTSQDNIVDKGTEVVDNDNATLELDTGIRNEIHNDHEHNEKITHTNNDFSSNQSIDSTNYEEKEKANVEPYYVHKSIFDVGEDKNNDKNTSSFLSLSSSSSSSASSTPSSNSQINNKPQKKVSFANTNLDDDNSNNERLFDSMHGENNSKKQVSKYDNLLKQSNNIENNETQERSKNGDFLTSSHDFNEDLETGVSYEDEALINSNNINKDDDDHVDDPTSYTLQTTPKKVTNINNNNESFVSRTNKKILYCFCLFSFVIAITLGTVLGIRAANSSDSNDNDDKKDHLPTLAPTPLSKYTLEKIYEKHGESNDKNFGSIISTNDDGNYIAISGNTATDDDDDDDRLLQIYKKEKIESENNDIKLTPIGYVSKGQNSSSNNKTFLLDAALSGNGNYIVISLHDSRFMLYSKPSTTEESNEPWVLIDQIYFSELSNTIIPVDISNNGTIIAVAIPNAMVDIYQLSSINNKLALLGSIIETPIQSTIGSSIEKPTTTKTNDNNFGASISLNSDGNRIAIASDNAAYVYEYNGVDDWINLNPSSLIPVDDADTTDKNVDIAHPSSISMNGIGDKICFGQSNYHHKQDKDDIIGQCTCYMLEKNVNEDNSSAYAYEANMIGDEPIYGEYAPTNERLGSVVELSKDGNIVAITSSGTNIVRVYELSSSTWVQIQPTLMEGGDGSNTNTSSSTSTFGASLSLSMDGSNIYIGCPIGELVGDTVNGTTYLYGEAKPHTKWKLIHTVQDATGSASMSDDGNVIAYNLDSNELYFYYFITNVLQKSAWSTYANTEIEIPGTDECIVKVLLNDPQGVINVKTNVGNGVWKSYPSVDSGVDKAVDLVIESVSVNAGCSRMVVGVPSYNEEAGMEAGMARVYNIEPGNLIPFGDDIPGKEGYRTGDSVSISNTGKIVAIGSPNANINGDNSGQVNIYDLDDENNTWKNVHTINGEEFDELGSSIYVSHDGTRIAIGSPKYSFENNIECGKVQVFHYNTISTVWEPLGNSIEGTKQSSHMGNLVTLSGDGNRLFVNDELHHVRIYQWKETDTTTTTTTSWTYAGQISADNMGAEAIDLTASMSGDRVTVGYKGSVSVYEYQVDELMKT